jgi:hypothetical protein
MINYSAKTPTIINYTLTNSNTWYKVVSEIKGVRKWFMKAKEDTDNSFDYDFTSTHATIMTNSGSGVSFDGCDLPDVYCRSATAGTVIEICYWS